MKLKPLLLICLLVLEAFMPCASTAACASHTQQEEVVCPHHASDANETDHSEEDEKHCSDGCRCYCCSVVLIPRLPSLTTQNQAPDHPVVISGSSHYHFVFTYSIWQPPKALNS